jgi:isopenicillin-N N-acyltransferase-like protein
LRKLLRGLAWTAGVLLGLALLAHYGVSATARLEPPDVPEVTGSLTGEPGGVRRFERSYARRVGRLWEIGLRGPPLRVGAAHAALLHDEMVSTERVVWQLFSDFVPNRVARVLLLDLAMWEYRDVAGGFSPDRIVEIAAQSRAFAPDPFDDFFPTYQRFVYLNALYDISLGFEHSPLIGCTTFVLSDPESAMMARAFDFEVHDVFDEQKAVFLVREDGRIPFASVAWPGLTGVVSGMNAEGVAVVVHGARAGPTRAAGEPVVHGLRRVLSEARTTGEAVVALARREPMVSHVVVLTDASGDAVAVERVPGLRPHVRKLGGRAAVTNHLEGPGRSDPKNERVQRETSTLARLSRAQEIVEGTPRVTPHAAVDLLRDRHARGDKALPLGDRRAIDALIATHGVVMDARNRVLWVSEAPHLLGRFMAFDLRALLDVNYSPGADEAPRDAIPADELLVSGRYAAWARRRPRVLR